MKRQTKILVIDDALDSRINKNLIEIFINNTVIDTVNDYSTAVNLLKQQINTDVDQLPDYIFFDINIHGEDGWHFLNELERLDIGQFKQISIYVTSYSIYRQDLLKSQASPLVEEFIHKPLNVEKILNIFSAA